MRASSTRRAFLGGVAASAASAASAAMRPGGGGGFQFASAAALLGPQLAALPTAALQARYHAALSPVTASGGLATQINDLVHAFHLLNTAGTGPALKVDAYGRPFWRFSGSAWLKFTGLVLTSTNMSVWVVGRHHRALAGGVCSIGNGSDANGNTGRGIMSVSISSGIAPYLCAGAISSSTDTVNRNRTILGSQMQVMGVVCGAGAGSTRIYVNETFATTTGMTSKTTVAGVSDGFILGRYEYGQAPISMDIYEVALYSAKQSAADANAVSAALMSAYNIPPIVNDLVLEGDSITQGFTGVDTGENIAMDMTVAANTRVVNLGTSGNTTVDLAGRAGAALGMHSAAAKLSGGSSRVLVQIGYNDIATGTGSGVRTAANVYNEAGSTASIVSLIGNTTNGYIGSGRYDKCVYLANIGCGNSTNYPVIQSLRALVRNKAQFRADCGNLTAAQLDTQDIFMVQANGAYRFYDQNNAGDTTYYITGAVHPNSYGYTFLASGGDTPSLGYNAAAVL